MRHTIYWHFATMALLFSLGCSSAQTSNTARTATEQLLISNAIDQSLDKVDFSTFNGHAVFLDDKYIDCVDKSYVVSSVRHRLLSSGARLVTAADQSDVVVEMRAGAVGTASAESFVGIPEIVLPGMLTLPEMRLLERKTQMGTAKIGLLAYDPTSGQSVGIGGTTLAKSDDSNWYVGGVGPFQNGSVRREIQRSTSGPAAITRSRLPVTVAFDAPQRNNAPQYANEIPTMPVERASLEETQPVWVDGK